MPCINCNIEFKGDFCPTCGEKKNVDRITFQSMASSVFSGLLEMDRGFLFNIKNLTLHPKTTIANYVKGKRRNILNPISYAIITITIYLFLDSILPRPPRVKLNDVDIYGAQEIGVKMGMFIKDKMKFLWLSYAIYAAFFTKLFFKKYNYFEHLAINLFILGHTTLVAVLIKPIYRKELILFNFFVFLYYGFLLYKFFKNPKDAFGTGALAFIVVLSSYLLFFSAPLLIIYFL